MSSQNAVIISHIFCNPTQDMASLDYYLGIIRIFNQEKYEIWEEIIAEQQNESVFELIQEEALNIKRHKAQEFEPLDDVPFSQHEEFKRQREALIDNTPFCQPNNYSDDADAIHVSNAYDSQDESES